MFISTYGYVTGFVEERSCTGFVHKAVDSERNVEVFKIGGASGVDEPFEGPIYCLKQEGLCEPFCVESVTQVATVPMTQFDIREGRCINPSIVFPVVKLTISNFGCDLKSIPLARASLHYMDLWGDGKIHGVEFPSASARSEAFKLIQEALPVLLFDDYELPWPRPAVCRHVSPGRQVELSEFDGSGTLEAASVELKAPLADPEGPMAVLDRLEKHRAQAPLRIEEIMTEILGLERGYLFFGHYYILPLMSSPRLMPLLRRSFDAHYAGHHAFFEYFYSDIIGLQASRLSSREVFERCVPRPWPQ
ncbi:MAG: hypothetical protein V4631_01170 [Pseudomonadota bacterium]